MKTSFISLLILALPTSIHAQTTNADSSLSQLLAKGDSLFTQEQYWDALVAYNKVCELDSTQCPKEKIELLKKTKIGSCNGGDAEWCKLLNAADKRFQQKDYAKAREYYQRAHNIRKNEEYPKKQIALIDQLIGKE